MAGQLVGYARVSTDAQDITAQREALIAAGVAAERIYVDHGRSGTNRARPGLEQAIAACWAGDTLVVTKLDRLARSAVDASTIAAELAAKDVRLSFNGSVYDPLDPMGRMIFGMLSVFAEFEANLISARTREGMATARAKGRLKGGKPKLSPKREALLVSMHRSGDYTSGELAELFDVARATVYRAINRHTVDVTAALALPRGDS
jgi:DNA invertase Pin-like site-specific DNA recombinase